MQTSSGDLVTPQPELKDLTSDQIGPASEPVPSYLQRTQSSTSFADANDDAYSEVVLRPHNVETRKVISASYTPSTPMASKKDFSNGVLQYKSKQRSNMVLQLVIPNNLSNDSMDSRNNRSATPISAISGEMRNFHSRPPSMYGQDYSSQNSSGLANRTTRSSTHSSTLPSPNHHHAVSATPEERKLMFSYTWTNTLSIIYAVFNVTLGLTFFTNRIVDPNEAVAEGFSIYLVSGSFLFILYILVDVTIYMRTKAVNQRLIENTGDDVVEVKQLDGQFQFKINLPPVKRIRHDYCFNMDRHSSNFFLKVGATAFCIGHLIHSGLLIAYRIAFWTMEERKRYNCTSIHTMVLDVLYPINSFLLLFFIFKYSNIIINKNTALARFGIMHCLSASLCFWAWTIVREILEAISYHPIKIIASTRRPNLSHVQLNKDTGTDFFTNVTDISNIKLGTFTRICDQVDDNLSKLYKNFSPYLYPFSVEYSILVVGVLYLVWQNIAICEDIDEHNSTRQCQNAAGSDHRIATESNVSIHVDCHASNKGLFVGFVILILVLISCIVFFIAIYGSSNLERGRKIGLLSNVTTNLIILAVMMVATVLGYYQISKLDINTSHNHLLDDFLLIICMPAFFLNAVFSIIPAVYYGNILNSTEIILEVIQVVVQTLFIIDGIRRSSNSKKLIQRKYGRELVTLLVLANISLWLMQTLEVKAKELTDQRYEYYGKTVWSIVGHICLPLIMFYRFHSAVCFGDMWKYCYEPSGH